MNRASIIIFLILFASCRANLELNKVEQIMEIIPSYFDNGERITFLLPTTNNDTIKAYTDTGGGFTALYPNTLKRLGLNKKIKTDLNSKSYILAKEVFKDKRFHPFLSENSKDLTNESFFAVPSQEFIHEYSVNESEVQGFFGQYFFINHCWTFDYINRTVKIHQACNIDIGSLNAQKVGFKKDSNNIKLFGHPSINIKIEGEEIPMLFDTGATIELTESAQNILKRKKEIGGSFIAKSIYEKWKKKHPNWKVIKGGNELVDGGKSYYLDLIEVPLVVLGSFEVGPVWFAVRPDAAWSKGMIRSMDRVVKGALGGSALKYVSVTIDYPNEAIEFKK